MTIRCIPALSDRKMLYNIRAHLPAIHCVVSGIYLVMHSGQDWIEFLRDLN